MTGETEADPLADVVVPVYGGWPYVQKCLAALLAQTVPVRVIVVDDCSPDDTLARMRSEFPSIDIIANAENKGFAASCNVGMSAGEADIVILLNSDVVATPEMASEIIDVFSRDTERKIGSVSPILLAGDGSVDSFGITADRTLGGFVRFNGARLADVDAAEPQLLGPYGAAAAYRRDALDAVGLLDENIFMYGEELDLALRLRAAGWGAAALARDVGTHIGGATAGKGSERQRYLSGFGRGYLLRRYGVLRTRYAVRAFAVEALVSLVRLVRLRDVASLRGRGDGWRRGRGLPRRTIPAHGIDDGIGLRRSLAMRSPGYWADSGA